MTEREIAEKMIKDGKAMLAELDKPELKPKHGSKMVYTNGSSRIALYAPNGALVGFNIETGLSGLSADSPLYTVLDEPTIFADLKAMSEPLTEFKVCNYDGDRKLRVELVNSNHIHFTLIFKGGQGANMTFDQASEIHRKLGRLIATAKRKLNENDL